MTASLEAAIFSVPGLGVDDLAAVFTLDSAHTGVDINEIFHQGVLIFAFPLFCCHRHPPLAATGVWWIMKSIICQKCYGSVAVIKMVTATFTQQSVTIVWLVIKMTTNQASSVMVEW